MGRVITAPGVLTNVQGQIDHVTDMYDDIKNNNLKPLTITLDPVSNANGAVSVVTEDPRVTEDMKPISIEVGTPEVFKAPITVTTASGTVTLACENAAGTSTVKATFIKTSPVESGADYPPAVTSTEFDILADRIGSLGELDTTDQSSVVNAVNEVVDSVEDVNSNLTSLRHNELTSGSLKTWVVNTAQEGFTCFRYNATVTDVPCTYGQGYCVKYNNNLRIVVFDMASTAQYTCYRQANSSTWSNWIALNDYAKLDGNSTGTILNGTAIETGASYTRCVVKNGWVNLKIRFSCPTITADRTAIFQLADKIIPPCDFSYIWAHGEWDESINGQMTISSDGKIYAQTNCSGKNLTLRATYPVLY